ncbi:MAG: RagB/SusD family nutrient uptake outer membrane protein [Marinifilaceae bacterium]|jgi:hypothetical protein|nr:RagB/SusD family nutrient uptake outer membrane protein [Marinifilaceae bacterium]
MKKLYTAVVLIVACLFLGACDDFLDTKPSDRIIPETIEHLSEYLLGEIINTKQDPIEQLQYLTDDIAQYKGTEASELDDINKWWGYFSFKKKPEYQKDGILNNETSWDIYYKDIFTCNVILDLADDVEGQETRRNRLKAETYFMRAFSYFQLVNIYGEVYTDKLDETSLGVPINDDTTLKDLVRTRASVQEVYKKIEDELKLSIELFKKGDEYYNMCRPSISAAYLLLSRVHLYKKEYTKVIEDINNFEGVNSRNPIRDLFSVAAKQKYLELENKEVIFRFKDSEDGVGKRDGTSSKFVASQELIDLYGGKTEREIQDIDDLDSDKNTSELITKEVNDDRRVELLTYKSSSNQFDKVGHMNYERVLRTSEAVLNKAEAMIYADPANYQAVIDYLNNNLRKYRIYEDALAVDLDEYFKTHKNLVSTDPAYTLEEQDKHLLVRQFVRDERRRELCMEGGHRWFDIRRYQDVNVKHTEVANLETHELKAGDDLFILPLPQIVLENNIKIRNIYSR